MLKEFCGGGRNLEEKLRGRSRPSSSSAAVHEGLPADGCVGGAVGPGRDARHSRLDHGGWEDREGKTDNARQNAISMGAMPHQALQVGQG